MVNRLNLAVYNPAILADEDFLAAFVARQDVLEKILKRLGQIGPQGMAEHRLIVGQRGMGKTSLLRRIAIAVERDPALSPVLLPLTFREEQYNVHNLHLFWCNCLDALGDYLERHDHTEQMAELDRHSAGIARAIPKNAVDDQPAYDCFMTWARRLERRPLLLLDNMDYIFDALDDKQTWTLRRQLQEAGGVVVIGAATRFLEAAGQPQAPFYEFFRVDLLNSLQHEEMQACLRELAQRRGEAGQKVLRLMGSDPARLRTLRDLSGGNPRTLVLLYLVLETDADGDVMTDLERLLDQVSALYKGRIEDLAPQARAVLDAVALNWDPITSGEIATATGIAATSISAQLERLVNLGLLEKCSLSRSAAAGYQLGERFFNIWYLMRHGPRRVRGRLRWLVEFLRGFYTPQERCELAQGLMQRRADDGKSVGQFALALRETLDDGALRHALGHHATRLLEDAAADTRTELAKIVDLSDLHGPTHSMAELRQQVLNCRRDWHGIDPAEFWDWLGGSPSYSCEKKPALVAHLPQLSKWQLQQLVEIFSQERSRLVELFGGDTTTVDALRHAYRDGLLDDPCHFDGEQAQAAADYLRCPSLPPTALAIALDAVSAGAEIDLDKTADWLNAHCQPSRHWAVCWLYMGNLLIQASRYPKTKQAYRRAIALDETFALPWNNLGNLLQNHLGRYEEAEQAYRQAIALDENWAWPWINLGNLLKNHLSYYEEAEQAYRRAIALDEKSALPWNNLGNLLQNHLGRHEEAEQVYRRAIALDKHWACPWYNLGDLLQYHLGRYEEAEQAYRQAIVLDEKHAVSWNNLGNLLQNYLGRYQEAEQAYRRAIALDEKYAAPWNGLGYLLRTYLGRYEEAEQAYRRSIALDEKNVLPWNNLGNLLQTHMGRYEEAKQAYCQAIALDKNRVGSWNNLGDLLQDHTGRCEETEHAYYQATTLDENWVRSWNNLGNLLQDHLGRYEEAELAYQEVLKREANNAFTIANLAYLLYPQADRMAEANGYGEHALAALPERAVCLLRAYRELTQDNFGAATAELRRALDSDHAELLSTHLDDLLRNLRLAAAKGYGDKLLAFLDDTGLAERYWPLRAAFDAYLHGAERLRDVNPEVRGAAQRLYDWLDSLRRHQTASAPAPERHPPPRRQPHKTRRSR